jgi:hypothetical protein
MAVVGVMLVTFEVAVGGSAVGFRLATPLGAALA